MQKKRILTKGGNPCVLRYQKRQGKTLASVRHERTEKWSRVSLQRAKKINWNSTTREKEGEQRFQKGGKITMIISRKRRAASVFPSAGKFPRGVERSYS